jgi:integrase
MHQQRSTTTTFQDRTIEQNLKGELVTFMFHLTKLNLDRKTVYERARNIDTLVKNGADLNNPDSILAVLATNERWGSGTKKNLLLSYKSYAKWKKISLSDIELPKFDKTAQQPYVPKENQLDQLIAGSGWKTGAFLQLLKETGARTKEAASLKWIDVDAANHTVTIRNPAKNGLPRQIHVSEKCTDILNKQPHTGDYLFGKDPERIRKRMRANFHWARGHIAAKTANKDLMMIHLHTFRHFFATKLYLQTRDIRYVQKKMGHRSITSTTIYENSEPNQDVETFMVKAVTSREEAEKLIALGYEFHYRTADGVDLFRKKVIGLD